MRKEFDLLAFFARHAGRVFRRQELLDQVWGYMHDGYEHTVNSHINRLRAKIESDPSQPKYILTVRGVGYKMAVPGESDEQRREYLDAAADTGFVRGDIGMIERVISNLVDNAIRHTPDGGEIRLSTHRTARGAEVTVADTGQGIAREHLPGLFERDSQLRIMAYKRGGGLGLLIVKRILTLHGGSMQAASEVGRGTVVSFVLPSAMAA